MSVWVVKIQAFKPCQIYQS